MHKVDSFGADPSNEFTEGDSGIPIPATRVGSKWLNSVQRELVEIVEDAGITLSDSVDDQIGDAIRLIATPPGTIDMYAGTADILVKTLESWLICDGRTIGHVGSGANIEAAHLQPLFDILKNVDPNAGTETWGVDTVLIPDLRERFAGGFRSGGADFPLLGGSYGSFSQGLDHTHGVVGGTVGTSSDGAHDHGTKTGTETINSPGTGHGAGGGPNFIAHDHPISSDGSHSHTVNGFNTGLTVLTANIVPPTIALNFKIKV